ncbi:MAG: hypothetical protein ACE5G2_01550 [Candidatus Krumholzibacteriia bacterium]
MGRRILLSTLHVLALAMLWPAASAGADPELPAPPISMGQPDRLRINWAPNVGYDFEKSEVTSRVSLDLTPEGIAPHLGIDFLNFEAAMGHSGESFDSALGLYVAFFFTRSGIEYNLSDAKFAPGFSVQVPLRRGGLFRIGDQLRVDYRPWEQEVMLGFSFNRPFRKYRATRPLWNHVSLPEGDAPRAFRFMAPERIDPELLRSLDAIEHSILWMDELLTPRFGFGDDFRESASNYKSHLQARGHSFEEEDAHYHQEMTRAFSIAVHGDEATGFALASAAEKILFEHVLVPYDRSFGRTRKPHVPAGHFERATREFAKVLDGRPEVASGGAKAQAMEVLNRVLVGIHKVVRAAEKRWGQSRLVWLPLNYGLRPEQLDTQEEWDHVLAALTAQEFSVENAIEYVLNERFHEELKELIRETESYQVTIVHDFRGRHGKNITDLSGWDVVENGYIRAFIQAIERLDRGESDRLPQFMLFLDQHYYQENKSRQIITFIENLYEADDVELKNEKVQERVSRAHRELIARIHASPVLQGLPDERIRELIKVHVNVTNPYDPAFPFDAVTRDHKKLAFRDVFEDDPASGVGILTGQGVGDHYTGSTWEDRSIILRGPGLVQLKRCTEQLFLSQGFDESEVPEYLMRRPFPDDYAERCKELKRRGWTASVLITLNDTGYGEKMSSVLKATIFNLAPKGSVLFSFDSLWISDFWAGMFVSAGLRGVRAYPVAPAPDNAPSDALPTMVLMRENLRMLLDARELFKAEIARAGGVLRVGLYAHEISVADDRRRALAFLRGREGYPFLEDEFPIHPKVIEVLRQAARTYDPDANIVAEGAPSDEDVRPFLHLKTSLFASQQAFEVLGLEEWVPALGEYLRVRARQVAGMESEGVTPHLLRAQRTAKHDGQTTRSILDRLQELPPDVEEKMILSLIIGSHNQDRRSMFLNGEDLLAVSGHDALIALPDFMFILGTASWPANPAELEEIFPDQDLPGFLRRFVRKLQDLI